ncbi:MAG: cadmium-translocating P-type ATPase [Spirochaetes bacterium]|uniref:P-type Cu(2+) transporter n=1 Tax=Candidatus Ornithospirochaeta stercoripullorum TaxID=2840899 RepID=A0A9D9H2T3_9SPIO|nr:cadmium-translocating P-type ATPase [Candidatus Ornithospirochaeta stercoripullorum]
MKECFDVTGMSCAACQVRVEKSVRKLDGVKEVNVNLLKNSMEVEYDENALTEDGIVSAVEKAGYGAIPKTEEAVQKSQKGKSEHRDIAKEEYKRMKKRLLWSLLFTVPLFYISMGHMMGWPLPSFLLGPENSMVFALTLFILVLPVTVINRKFFIGGFKSLFHLSPNMDSLIAMGSGAALVYGIYAMYKIAFALGSGDFGTAHAFAMDLYFESAGMILTLITLGKTLEARAKGRTSEAIEKLMNLAPKTAVVIRDGKEREIPAEELVKGDIAVVRAGTSIPADGTLIEGSGAVDESAITGESIPVDKVSGDKLTGATVLSSGYLKMRIDSVGEDTALQKIIKLVDEATSSKAPIAKLADKVSGVFVPIVIGIALVSAIAWLIAGESFEFALSIAISVLVISCPCALGLATPTAIMVGTGRGASSGILIKSAEALETLHSINTVVFDKTGTITEGKPSVTDIITINGGDADSLLVKAGSLEKLSGHPLGEAIVREAEKRGLELLPASAFFAEEGKGVTAKVAGSSISGGNRKMLASVPSKLAELEERLADEGKTPLFFTEDGVLIGIIALADTIKPSSRQAISDLKTMGIRTVMLTGDNKRTARAIQNEAGTDSFIAEVLPQEKDSEVRKLQNDGMTVAMVGDGINDAPALARANTGIAIGAGTDIAIESADIVLMKSDLEDVPKAIELGKATMRNIKENLFWALFYNAICIPVAAGVLYPAFGMKLSPMVGAFAMSFSSVFVVSNALRLRFFKAKAGRNAQHQMTDKRTGCVVSDIEMNDKIGETTPEGENIMTKTINVEGMMCQHCVKHVHDALAAVVGVKSAEVSLENKYAKVECAETVSDDALKEAVVEAGYEVKGIEG